VRQPASFCGVVGIKPTYGRVSRYGLVAFASSLDQIGTIANTVADAALLLEVIAGYDAFDSTSADRPVGDLLAAVDAGVRGLSIGVPAEYFGEGLDAAVAAACADAIDALTRAGAAVREIHLPNTRYAIPTYYLLAPAEASSNLARYDGVRFGPGKADASSARELYDTTRGGGFGAEVKRRIMLGTFALSAGYHDAYYGRAQRVRRLIANDFDAAFLAGVDVIFTPTTPAPAFPIGERSSDPYTMYLSDVYTVTANLAGLPAASVPVGRTNGLPIGGQLIASHWREDLVVRVAAAVERAVAP
jgi:aspartyl-tRNA(Asn)/glutamyl-tRNA(Gln) amidotransferase subunit A